MAQNGEGRLRAVPSASRCSSRERASTPAPSWDTWGHGEGLGAPVQVSLSLPREITGLKCYSLSCCLLCLLLIWHYYFLMRMYFSELELLTERKRCGVFFFFKFPVWYEVAMWVRFPGNRGRPACDWMSLQTRPWVSKGVWMPDKQLTEIIPGLLVLCWQDERLQYY